MRTWMLLAVLVYCQYTHGQRRDDVVANVRLSFLMFPFSPLLTVEVRLVNKLSLQLESNFTNTHGVNAKYYMRTGLEGHYVFSGLALVNNKLLRDDDRTVFLPYAGYGYASRFGTKKRWTFDSRVGIGATTNATINSVYPVIKTGIGRVF